MKLQFYIDQNSQLFHEIEKEAKSKGFSMSAVIMERLEKAYGIILSSEDDSEDVKAFSAILDGIRKDVEEYVRNWMADSSSCAQEFTLQVSPTFARISMADESGRLTAMKPKLGKAFRGLVDQKAIPHVRPALTVDGKQRRRYNAALYEIEK